MEPDDHVCLCYRVSQRKIANYLKREEPSVASLISECLDAGTGCGWCVPFLEKMHRQWQAGEEPDLKVAPESYAKRRLAYHETQKRDDDAERGE